MPELAIGKNVSVEDYRSTVVWSGCVARAGGSLLVVSAEKPPPIDLKPNAPLRVCFDEGRWLVKVRGRVLEREQNTLKILLVGREERVQRRTHIRVPVGQTTQVSVTSHDSGTRVVAAEIVDISEGGYQLSSNTAFAVGETVEATCDLNGAFVRLPGEVVRASLEDDGWSVGIRLASGAPARKAIARFVIACSLSSSRALAPAGLRSVG
jgi:hypothetical protein